MAATTRFAEPAFQAMGNNDIKIPIGTGIPGKATTNVVMQGNLSAAAVGALVTSQMTRLRTLDLSENLLGDAGVLRLLAAPWPGGAQ